MNRILYFPALLLITIFTVTMALSACQLQDRENKLGKHSPKYLKLKLTRLLELAQNTKSQSQLQSKLKKSILNAQQVESLLREHPLRQELSSFYETKLAQPALKELAWTLQECAELGYSRIEVSRVGPHAGGSNAHGDLALLELLKSRDGLYTVRLKRNETDQQALRISGWLYHQDLGWVTLLKLGEEILNQK